MYGTHGRNMSQFRFIEHALKEIERRAIPMESILEALENPDQIVPNIEGREAYHKQILVNAKVYLLRIIVENDDTVVTVYRTSKVSKYWSDE